MDQEVVFSQTLTSASPELVKLYILLYYYIVSIVIITFVHVQCT